MHELKVLVVSRTPWYEPPRIRHQLTRIFREMGYDVHYVECLYRKSPSEVKVVEGIRLYHIKEPFHHQTKPFGIIRNVFAGLAKNRLRKVLKDTDFSLIVNFNYDYDFLGSLFPNVPMLTFMNDDFIASAKPWMKRSTKASLQKLGKHSFKMLSVSYSINAQLKQFCEDAELFLPWSDQIYSKPPQSQSRDWVLYYGYISRVDEEILDHLCSSNTKLRFIGPLEGNGEKVKKKYEKLDNVEFLAPTPLQNVNLDDVCCSIALYDRTSEANNAITASNRLFRLLSLGIPLVYPLMPNLIKAPENVLRKCDASQEFIESITYFKQNFEHVQNDISEFMKMHTREKRMEQLKKILEPVFLKVPNSV